MEKNIEKIENSSSEELVSQDDVRFVNADWKDPEGLIKGFKNTLEYFGLHMYENPVCIGTDQYGFIISKIELDDEKIDYVARQYDPEFYDDSFFDED